jgi:hypothetical protein
MDMVILLSDLFLDDAAAKVDHLEYISSIHSLQDIRYAKKMRSTRQLA